MSKRKNIRAKQLVDIEAAELELIELVARMVRALKVSDLCGDAAQRTAVEIVESILLDHPDLVQRLAYPDARRFWYYERDRLHMDVVPWVMRAGDEYGNDTVAFRVPFGGQFVAVTNRRLRRLVEPSRGFDSEKKG